MTRRGSVRLDGVRVGEIAEAAPHGPTTDAATARFRFTYDEEWLEREDAVAISSTLPLRAEPYESPSVVSVFENLLPEGWLRDRAVTAHALQPGDVFGLLLRMGADMAGAVEVLPAGGPAPCGPALPTLAGVHQKISVTVTAQRRSVRVKPGPGRHILKPQSPAWLLPENEHLTLQIARAAGLEVAECRLVPADGGSPACLVKRFDRPDDGSKLRVEDFCQLAGKLSREKYDGTAEMCAEIVKHHATEPIVESARLFRHMVVAWWTGNGHVHLKNLALLTGDDGITRLSPAYDLQCTSLACGDAPLALGVNGKRRDIARGDWLAYAGACGLRRPAAERVLRGVASATEEAVRLVSESHLDPDAKRRYARLLRERTAALDGEV